MLIGDLHTLHTIHFLNFVHEVLLHFSNTADLQDIVRIDRTVGKTLTRTDGIAFLNENVLTERNRVLAAIGAIVRGYNDNARTTTRLLEVDRSVDLGNRSRIRRRTGFEELGNAWQTARDVAGLTGLTV